jgi:hypothetical protein
MPAFACGKSVDAAMRPGLSHRSRPARLDHNEIVDDITVEASRDVSEIDWAGFRWMADSAVNGSSTGDLARCR